MTEIKTYTRTVKVPVRTLTAKKTGLLNRAMKDYLRVRKYASEYFQQHDAFDFGYDELNDLYQEIGDYDDINLPTKTILAGIKVVEQNYKEFEKDSNAEFPWPENADTLALEGQSTYLYYDDEYYVNVNTGPKPVNIPLLVSSGDYHQNRFPKKDAIPPTGRSRIGIQFAEIADSDFPKNAVKLSTSTLQKHGKRDFVAHLVFQHEKRVTRNTDSMRYIVGVDRGRNELAYAALYDSQEDHVEDWGHANGDEIRHYMDEYSERIQSVQENNALDQMNRLRKRRFRYKKQTDYEVANMVVDLARQKDSIGIALEDLNMGEMGNYSVERRRFNEWSYSRLAEFIKQKAKPYDVPVITVDPAYTSQQCSRCGEEEDARRQSVHFECQSCGYQQHADANAAVNIAKAATGV